MTTADTVQKSSVAGYRALGKEVSTRTGYQLPGATPAYDQLGSPSLRHDEDYDDFWADNGVSDTDSKKESASFVGQKSGPVQNKANANPPKDGKDDDWENW
jgi:hypothetical protein